jgi:hypothetical protein
MNVPASNTLTGAFPPEGGGSQGDRDMRERIHRDGGMDMDDVARTDRSQRSEIFAPCRSMANVGARETSVST